MQEQANAPRTRGANLASLTIRERAEAAWRASASDERKKAERNARQLAQVIFGNEVAIEFADLIDSGYAYRRGYAPKQLVAFEVEGLRFNYYGGDRDYSPCFWLLDKCQTCERGGPRVIGSVRTLSDIGRLFSIDWSAKKCGECLDDDDASKR